MYLGWTIGLLVIIFSFLLVAQATKMTNLFANTTLVLTCWTPEPFSVSGVTTFTACVLPCVLRIMSSMFLWLSCITVLVGFLPLFEGFSFLVRLTGWYPCVLMSQKINLNHLWVSGNLLHVLCSCLWTVHLFGKLSYCTCWKLVQFHMAFI